MRRSIFCLFLAFIFGQAVLAQPNQHESKEIIFRVKNFGLTVEGSLRGLEGEIRFDPQNLSANIFNVSIDANSIDTGITLRDNHLRKQEYLDVKNYPRIKFVSLYVDKGDEPDQWMLTGELTIKKTTKKISFPFSVSAKPGSSNFKGQFKINRRDFGVGGKSISMADELTIDLNVNTKTIQ